MSEDYRKILFVAPSDLGLDVAPEVDTIAGLGYQVRSIEGRVTSDRIFDNVTREGSDVDILHVASHSGDAGVTLSDGEVLPMGGLLQVARNCNARLVFLNGCSNARIAHYLVDNAVPAVIGTMDDIPDLQAKHTAQTFYRLLRRMGADVQGAYKGSKTRSDGGYIMVTNGRYCEAMVAPVLERIREMEDKREAADLVIGEKLAQVGRGLTRAERVMLGLAVLVVVVAVILYIHIR